MKSERETNIEQIAGLIYDAAWQDDWITIPGRVEEINATHGWTFYARYGHEAPGGWTWVEGLRLSDEDLRLAVQLADWWGQGIYHVTVRDLMGREDETR